MHEHFYSRHISPTTNLKFKNVLMFNLFIRRLKFPKNFEIIKRKLPTLHIWPKRSLCPGLTRTSCVHIPVEANFLMIYFKVVEFLPILVSTHDLIVSNFELIYRKRKRKSLIFQLITTNWSRDNHFSWNHPVFFSKISIFHEKLLLLLLHGRVVARNSSQITWKIKQNSTEWDENKHST